MSSYFGMLSAGNLYWAYTVGHCILNVMKMSSAQNISSALNRWTSESFGSRNYG